MAELSNDQLLRYARNILLNQVDVSGQAVLLNSHVAVVGAGGLGAPLLQYLAAAGVGTISIIDDDVVDETNLQRQVIHDTTQIGVLKAESAKQFIARLNPDIKVNAINLKLDSFNCNELLKGVDLVAIGTDNFQSRVDVNRFCQQQKIALVTGAAIGSSGQLTSFDFKKHSSPCFECVYPNDDEQLTCATSGVFGPVVGTIGSAMAMEVLKILLSVGKPLFGRLATWDAMSMEWMNFNYQNSTKCPNCSTKDRE